MRYELSTGKMVDVKFNFEYHKVPIKKYMSLYEKANNLHSCPSELKPYKTTLTLVIVNEDEDSCIPFNTTSICHKLDNFSKLKGRLLAYNKLGSVGLNDYLSKKERRELFHKVFPQFSNNKNTLTYCSGKFTINSEHKLQNYKGTSTILGNISGFFKYLLGF